MRRRGGEGKGKVKEEGGEGGKREK